MTSQFFSIIWWFRPWKPYVFWMHIILADHPDHPAHLDHLDHMWKPWPPGPPKSHRQHGPPRWTTLLTWTTLTSDHAGSTVHYSRAELQKRANRANQLVLFFLANFFLVLIFLGEKLVGANFYAFCNYAAGVDAPPRREGWFPSPPRPIKIIKTAGKLQGKIKAQISTFSNRGDKCLNNITTLIKQY